MINPNVWAVNIRELLREEGDGLTVQEISKLLDAPKSSIYWALTNTMPDAYIDRWTEPNKYNPTEAVWCVVVPPENCPRPDPKKDESYD